jgi:hypothetical protein
MNGRSVTQAGKSCRSGWQIPNSGFVLPDILREDCRVARPAGAGHRNPTYEELKDQQSLLTYFHYPQEHWLSLKTTNPIESIFATVKLRTNAARRIKSPRSALYLLFQLILRAQTKWRRINAPHLMTKVLEGVTFKDGIEVRKEKNNQAEKHAA